MLTLFSYFWKIFSRMNYFSFSFAFLYFDCWEYIQIADIARKPVVWELVYIKFLGQHSFLEVEAYVINRNQTSILKITFLFFVFETCAVFFWPILSTYTWPYLLINSKCLFACCFRFGHNFFHLWDWDTFLFCRKQLSEVLLKFIIKRQTQWKAAGGCKICSEGHEL